MAQAGVTAEHAALLAALQQAPMVMQLDQVSPGGSGASGASQNYRTRCSTSFRGVTKTSGTSSGLMKYDVQ